MTTIEIADALTVEDVTLLCAEISKIIGQKSNVYANISPNVGCSIALYPLGICASQGERFSGATWSEAFRKARKWALTGGVVYSNATIRRMALAVIEITDEHGECTVAALRRQKFDDVEIEAFKEDACQRANEMCQGRPFVVLP